MGIIENIRENVRDLGQGARDVVTGRETSPEIRRRERVLKDFEGRDIPSPTDPRKGFTPVKDSRGVVITSGTTVGTGRGRTPEKGLTAGEILAQQETARRAAELTRKKAIESARRAAELARQRSQATLRGQEIFSPESGKFVRRSDPSGQGTAIVRQPTPQERIIIEESQRRGSVKSVIKSLEKGATKVTGLILPSEEETKEITARKEAMGTPVGGGKKLPDIKKPFDVAAEGILDVGSFVTKELNLPNPQPPINITRTQAKEVISTGLLFATFEPVMRTGTAQQTSQFTEVIDPKTGTKRFIKKADVKDFLESPKVEVTGKTVTVKKLKFVDKSDRVKELLRAAKTPEQKAKVIELAKETFGEDFVKEFASQEFGVIQQPTVIKTKTSTPIQTAELKGVSILETGTAQVTKPLVSQRSVLDISIDQKSMLDTKTIQDSKVAQETKQTPRAITLVGTSPITKTKQETKTETETKQDFKPITITTSALSTPQKTIQELREPQGGEEVFQKPKEPGKKIPLIPKTKGVLGMKKSVAKEKVKSLFKIFARVKGQDVQVGEAATIQKAGKKLKKELKTGIEASGFIEEPTGRRVEASVLEDFGFGVSKIDSFRLVQKREGRLGTSAEVKEIQFFKKSKGGGNPKRKKRKKSQFF